MKADLNIRIFFMILFLSLISITFYSTATNAQPGTSVSRNDPACTVNGTALTPAAAGVLAAPLMVHAGSFLVIEVPGCAFVAVE